MRIQNYFLVLALVLASPMLFVAELNAQSNKNRQEQTEEKGILSVFKKKDTESNKDVKTKSEIEEKDKKSLKILHKDAKSEVKASKKERKAAEAKEEAARARADAIKAEKRAARKESKADKAEEKAVKTRSKANSKD